MKGRVWINFKELRARLKFEDVLEHFKVEVRRKGEQHMGPCPLPDHDPQKRGPSFSANLDRGIFHCFGCGAKGNVLEFAALMSGVDPKDGNALRKVAVELQQKFFPEGASTRTRETPRVSEPAAPPAQQALINPPLDFELKGLDAGHPYFEAHGFNRNTVAHFGVGFCSRGVHKDRVAIPLHDGEGRLVGYAGRVVDDKAVSEANPSYLFPSGRERGGTAIEFRKSLLLYNQHRLKAPVVDLVVVEWFPSVWWLNQCGLPSAVALMGSECSEEQTELIVSSVKPSGHVWLMTAGYEAGDELGRLIVGRLARHRFVRWVRLDEDRQPTDLSASELKTCFTR